MDWWSILKNIQNPPQGAPQTNWYNTQQQQITARNPIDKTPQYDPQRVLNMPTTSPIESDTAVDNQQVQPGIDGQTNITQPFITPQQLQTQNTQYTGTSEAGGDDFTDDTDVGTVRENVNRAKQNLTQLPRGPKALQITQILTDLSAAAIDPVNQKNIAIEAKRKLQEAFPQVS
mgnify:CR=1 FL=1